MRDHRIGLKKYSSTGPAPSWGEFAGQVGHEALENVPPMLGVGGLGGLGIGALVGGQRGSTIGAGAGLGGVAGMTGGSILAQALARLGGPMAGLNPNQTQTLMNHANLLGSGAGGLLGAYAGGRMGANVADRDKTAMFGMGDPGRNAIPGANMLKKPVGAVNAIEKLQQAHAAARAAGIAQPAKAVAPVSTTTLNAPGIGNWMTPEMRAAMEANMKSSALRKIAASIISEPIDRVGHHMVEAGKGHGNILPYAGLAGAVGGGLGYALGDPAAGVGGGAGAALGGAGGNIVGSGLGALAGALLGRHAGIAGPASNKLIDQWAHGGSHVGNILGSLYGGYKGIGMARRIAEHKEGKEAVLKEAAAPTAAAGATGLTGGLKMPGLGWKGNALVGAGLAGMGVAGVGNLMYHGGRTQVADRDKDFRDAESRDFLHTQHQLENKRQELMMDRLQHPMHYYDPSTRVY